MPRGSCLAARRREVTVASVAAISSRYRLVLLALPRACLIANARLLASRRWLRQGTASPPGRALACSSRRTITRTESHSRLLSLGSCISALQTVLSSRTTVPDHSAGLHLLLLSAVQKSPIDPLPRLGADRAYGLVQHRFLRASRQRQSREGAKRGRILQMKRQLLVAQLPV